MMTPLENINWSVRTYNVLKRSGINFLEELNDEHKMKEINLDIWAIDEIEEVQDRFESAMFQSEEE